MSIQFFKLDLIVSSQICAFTQRSHEAVLVYSTIHFSFTSFSTLMSDFDHNTDM